VSSHWTIRPLCVGEFAALEKSKFTYDRNAGEKVVAPCFSWLLQSEAETILVDTGPSAPDQANRWHPGTRRTAAQAPAAALHGAGVAPEGIARVILTHLHWDHCYNLDLFPHARFLVQAEELRAAVDPIPTQRPIYEIGLPGLQPPWLPFFGQLQLLRGDTEIAPGLSVVLLPGHTPGLQGVLVETAEGRYLIASDAVPLYENLPQADRGAIPSGLHIDVAACLQSMERMARLADEILPGHDLRVLDRPRYP
jgi:N-acyl homoserine lactone hydrolase